MEVKLKDSLNRRKRDVRQPTGKVIEELTSADFLVFQKIHLHGPLPSSILWAFVKPTVTYTDETRFKKRLGDLFNEDHTPHKAQYLDRPAAQDETKGGGFNNYIVYTLRPAAIAALKAVGKFSPDAPKLFREFPHQLMTACATASIELACIERGLRFIHAPEILARAETTRVIPDVPFYDPVKKVRMTRNLIPDAIFGIEYSFGPIIFCLEADRNSEPIEYNSTRKTYERCLLQYKSLIAAGLYKKHFKLEHTPMLVLHLTVNERHMKNVMACLPTASNYQLFKFAADFARPFKPPAAPLDFLVSEPWLRFGREPFWLSNPT